ncbi:MAG: hypothetical protein LBB05_00800 [Puniceicoccales bacterium]|jgi:hypothetical protein|nr:hypothetical protein [Puniceicoccales bacterium]
MGCDLAMAAEAAKTERERALKVDAAAIVDNFEKLKTGSAEEKIAAREFLISKSIMPGNLFRQSHVDFVWSDGLRSLTKYVVRVRSDNCTGTGTLVDMGIPRLKGRVIVTCAHVVFPISWDLRRCRSLTQMFDGNRFFEFTDLQTFGHLGMYRDENFSEKGFFIFEEDTIARLSVVAEPRQGQTIDRIYVSDIYIFTDNSEERNYYDICLLILDKPVVFDEEIVSGIPLDQLKPMGGSLVIGNTHPYHICLPEERPEGELGDWLLIVAGYGLAGIREMPMAYPYLPPDIKRDVFGDGIKKAISLRGVDLNGVGFKQNILGCRCVDSMHDKLKLDEMEAEFALHELDYFLNAAKNDFKGAENAFSRCSDSMLGDQGQQEWAKFAKEQLVSAKERLTFARERAVSIVAELSEKRSSVKAMIPFYGRSQVGSGFSGSLIVLKGQNESYDVLGILSGPLFTSDIKDFMWNAAQRQLQIEEQLSAGSSVAVSVVRRAKSGVTILWEYVTAFMMFLRHAVTRFQ